MTAESIGVRTEPASFVLGRKLDSVPFSAYHVVIILVLGFVGFIEGYDLALTGSLLVLAKALFGRIFAGVIVPYVMVSHTASPTIFFGTMIVMVLIGACIPFALGRETLGNLENFTEAVPGLALTRIAGTGQPPDHRTAPIADGARWPMLAFSQV